MQPKKSLAFAQNAGNSDSGSSIGYSRKVSQISEENKRDPASRVLKNRKKKEKYISEFKEEKTDGFIVR